MRLYKGAHKGRFCPVDRRPFVAFIGIDNMKQTITSYSFRQAFKDAGRESQFSLTALDALFDYFEQYEQDSGEQIELDVVAICCEYIEESYKDTAYSYNIALDDEDSEAEHIQQVKDFLETETIMVSEDDGIIVYQQF
jgi:hypothetical protein